MIVLVVFYPLVMLLGRFLSPWIASQPPALSIFIGNLLSVGLLTWLCLPWLNRAFGFWLTPDATARKYDGSVRDLPCRLGRICGRDRHFPWCFNSYRR